MHRLSDNLYMQSVLDSTDIGGTNATSDYVDMREYDYVAFIVAVDTSNWDSGDDLDTCKLREATDASGSDVQDLSGKAVDDGTDPEGLQYCLEVKADELSAGFSHVACYVAEAGNTGVDRVQIFAVGYPARHAVANESSFEERVF